MLVVGVMVAGARIPVMPALVRTAVASGVVSALITVMCVASRMCSAWKQKEWQGRQDQNDVTFHFGFPF
jgi:hypothetical protein